MSAMVPLLQSGWIGVAGKAEHDEDSEQGSGQRNRALAADDEAEENEEESGRGHHQDAFGQSDPPISETTMASASVQW